MPIRTLRPPVRQTPKPALKKYESDDYDYESDLPKITTAKDTNQPNLLSEYSYEESSYESYSSEKNWKSATKTPVRRVNPISPSPRPPSNKQPSGGPMRPFPTGKNVRPISRPTPTKVTQTKMQTPPQVSAPAEIKDDYDYDYDYEYSDQVNERIVETKFEQKIETKKKQSPVSNDIPISQPPSPPSDTLPSKPGQSEQMEIASSQNQSTKGNEQDVHNSHNESNLPIHLSPQLDHTKVQNDDDEKTFQIVYEQTNLGKFWKRHVQMTKDDVLIYICKSIKKKPYGKVHIICTRQPVELSSPNLVGMIVRHQSGSRFTLYEKADDIGVANPQLAGIAFGNIKTNARIRMFHIAIPEPGTSYKPVDKHNDLSRIASNNNEEKVPNVRVYASAVPVKKEDGTLVLYFGPYSIMRSTKNFVVRDEKNSPIFTIFKTFDGICTLKVRPPFTPLIGFATAVAISTSNK